MAETKGSFSGLTADEARAYHGYFVTGFIVFTVIAIIAHFLKQRLWALRLLFT